MEDESGTATTQIKSPKPEITSTLHSTATTLAEPDSLASTAPTDTQMTAVSENISKSIPSLRFTKPFLAAQTAFTKSTPHPEIDLISTYGLSWLASTVARTDPVTGEKINKLRRSYEGQIKAFGLAGRNKAIKWDPSHGDSIAGLAQAPAEDYYNSRVAGKEVTRGLSEGSKARLAKILELVPGPVPRNAEWESALGFGMEKAKGAVEDSGKMKKVEAPIATNTAAATTTAAKINGYMNGTSKTGKDGDINRPKRAGKKRRYNDESFEGYGEGYDDEGDSSDTGSRKSVSSRQKRPKIAGYG